ncbi:MAG TPA: hypothetical protein VN695_16935 [Streptosporangiaceae bacterium]|nr:hypothetical protein [Streptosporangiaceae bacterium]
MAASESPISENPASENPVSDNPISGEVDHGAGEVDHGAGAVDRRAVLKALSGTAAMAVAGPAFAIPLASRENSRYALVARQTRAVAPDSPTVKFGFQAVRTQDMLYLGFEFYNCKRVVRGGQTFVVPLSATQPALMVVIFQPQHIGEQSVEFSTSMTGFPFPPLHGALAGNSWLAFELPKHAAIPLTIEGLLTWTNLKPQLVPVVANPAKGVPAAPDPLHSALEVPWGLWLSPPANALWQHTFSPVTSGGRTELWHTRLGVHGVASPHPPPKIKAFWSTTQPDPFFMPLSPTDRSNIVSLTCSVVPGGGPAEANLLALSALGATIDIQGSWNPQQGSGISLRSWTHRASLGRDSYVRVVNLGYLFPFGNQAVKVKITDREFHVDPNGDVVAYLVTREFIVVTQPTINFRGDANEPFSGRGNPIRQVTLNTVSTPPIDFDTSSDPGIVVGSFDPSVVLWVRSGGRDIPFACTVSDIEGRGVDITTSVIWLDATLTDFDSIDSIATVYDAAGPARNTPTFGGALFAFAQTDGAPVGSTAHHVDTYTLTAEFAPNGTSNFYPMLNSAQIRLPGAEQLVGTGSPSAADDTEQPASAAVTSLPSPTVFIHDHYKTNGFPAGVTEVYLAILNNAPSLGFPVNLVGGLVPPNFDMSGLARDIGPVAGDLTKLLGGTFDPTQYFSVLSGGIGKLLGSIPITDIISAVDPDSAATNAQAPQISSKFIYPNNDKTQLPTALDTMLKWQPKVQGDPLGVFKPNNSKLLITAEIMVPISQPAQATYKIHGELNNFELVLFGSDASFIGITFTSLTFDSSTGSKTSIQPKIDSVTFLGPLTFIQDLEQLLASIGGPSIDVSASGINASYSLALPDVTVGVFSLSNLSINAGLNIPFDGSPVRVRFGLCTQDNPFLLTVWIFGGGGYFSLALGADGIEELQVELEFGAAVSIDLGVASGGVSIMAGIYFSLQTTPTKLIQLTGFLRADGNLSILGIISISLEFYLALTYLDPGQAYGEATVKVSISVLFFSTTVSATMRKTLGGGSDPDFRQAISQANWDTYCEAFS